MKNIIKAMFFDYQSAKKTKIFPVLLLSVIFWTIAITSLVSTYIKVGSNWHLFLLIIYSALYSSVFILICSLTQSLFQAGTLPFKDSFKIGLTAFLPMVPIALVSIAFKYTWWFYPEHTIIVGGFFLIFSFSKAISVNRGSFLTILGLIIITMFTSALLGPVMFEIFKL